VAKTASYNRSSFKKIAKDYDTKDIRKYIDALSKRVEKHFNEDGINEAPTGNKSNAVIADVWRACEEEVLRATETFTKVTKQCYSDSGVSLEYTKVDVEAAFKKHAVQ